MTNPQRICFLGTPLVLVAFLSLAAGTTRAGTSGWVLEWSDEFDGPLGSPPDPSKWIHQKGANGWGNHELENYTESPRNAFLDGKGNLVIRAVREPGGSYTSARLTTEGRFHFRYGKIEARLQIPVGQGIWPAFWLLGANISTVKWPQCGEIDLMEHIGREPRFIHATVHGPGYEGGKGITARVAAELPGQFHVYGAEWGPGSIQFYLDGERYATVTPSQLPPGKEWVFDHPFYILLNVAVGGDWPGNPAATTEFPQSMMVDWVRVWKSAPAPAAASAARDASGAKR